jgi:hypothetical protein
MNISERFYKRLTKYQHTENNKWFDMMFRLVNDGGYLGLTNIGVVLQKTQNGWVHVQKEGVK